MQTVAETPEHIKRAEELLFNERRKDLLLYLAEQPKDANLSEGSGGIHKLRWARSGRGKSGGFRVIYYI